MLPGKFFPSAYFALLAYTLFISEQLSQPIGLKESPHSKIPIKPLCSKVLSPFPDTEDNFTTYLTFLEFFINYMTNYITFCI